MKFFNFLSNSIAAFDILAVNYIFWGVGSSLVTFMNKIPQMLILLIRDIIIMLGALNSSISLLFPTHFYRVLTDLASLWALLDAISNFFAESFTLSISNNFCFSLFLSNTKLSFSLCMVL